jgi:hypothetical protein
VELPTSSCHGVLYLRYYGLVGTFSSKPPGGSRGVVLPSPRVWKGCQWLSTREWYLMHNSNPSITGGQKHTHTHTLPSFRDLYLPLYKCQKSCPVLHHIPSIRLQKLKTWNQIFLNKTQNRVSKISLLAIPIVIDPYLTFVCLA